MRVRNPKKMQYIFRSKSTLARLYFYFSQFQEVVKDSEILCAISTDPPALPCSSQNFKLKLFFSNLK